MKPTQEQVIAWAREVGAVTVYDAEVGLFGDKKVEALAALAYEAGRADETEACAQEAENRWLDKAHCTAEEMYEMQKKSIAAAIRARREQ